MPTTDELPAYVERAERVADRLEALMPKVDEATERLEQILVDHMAAKAERDA